MNQAQTTMGLPQMPQVKGVDEKEVGKYRSAGEHWLQAVSFITIANDEQYQVAGNQLAQIKTARKNIETYFKPAIDSANNVLKFLKSVRDGVLDVYEQAEDMLGGRGGKMPTYIAAKQEAALAEQRKLQEIARKEAEKKAVRAEKKGDTDKADMLRQTGEMNAAAVRVEAAPPKIEGLSVRNIWTFKVTDEVALIKAVADGEATWPSSNSILLICRRHW